MNKIILFELGMTDSTCPEAEVSTRVTHSVSMNESEPSVLFYQAQLQVADTTSTTTSTGTILGEQDLTIWQHTPPSVALSTGLRFTPP